MVKHNKNFKSKKKQSLKKKALRKTKRKGGKKSIKGGKDILYHRNRIWGLLTEGQQGIEYDKGNCVTADFCATTLILTPIIAVSILAGEILIMAYAISRSAGEGVFDGAIDGVRKLRKYLKQRQLARNTANRGGSIFRDGKALTHVSNELCKNRHAEYVYTHKSRGMLETHDEIYVCNGEGKIKIL